MADKVMLELTLGEVELLQRMLDQRIKSLNYSLRQGTKTFKTERKLLIKASEDLYDGISVARENYIYDRKEVA